MWDGGVATWNRSSGPRPKAAHQSVVACRIEACVCRTALGSPVVPELNTSTASSASSTSTGSIGDQLDLKTVATVGPSSRSVTETGSIWAATGDTVASSTTA